MQAANKLRSFLRRAIPFRILCVIRSIKAWVMVAMAWLNRRKKPLVLIYQSGKVGSVSFYTAIKETGHFSVFHIHRMCKEHILERRRLSKDKGWRIEAGDEVGLVLQRYISAFPVVKLICPIREPVSRNVSAFFQNAVRIPVDFSRLSEKEKLALFYSEYDHQEAGKWIDSELKATTGIDVYQYPFDCERGFKVIREGNFELLIMYHDLPDKKKSDVVSDFLNDPVVIEHLHGSDQKEIADSYISMRTMVLQDDLYVDNLHKGRYYRHFYGAKETKL